MRGERLKRYKALCLFFSLMLLISACHKAPLREPYRTEELHRLLSQALRASERGDPERAIDLYKEALKFSRLLQDDRNTLIILISLSRLFTQTGQLEEARDIISSAKALKERQTVDLPYDLLEELQLEEARIEFLRGRLRESEILLTGDVSNSGLVNSKVLNIRIKALNILGRIYLEDRRYEEAERVFQSSLGINKSVSSIEEANSHRLLGELYTLVIRDNPSVAPKAEFHLLTALSIDRKLALPDKVGLDMEALGKLYRDIADMKRAREYFMRAFEIWQLKGDRTRSEKIKRILEEMEGR